MFYQDPPQKSLRFGDVVQGYVLACPNIEDWPDNKDFIIDINRSDLCVVLTPCCSIKDCVISLAPLKKVPSDYFKNPYLADDMTRINRKMTKYDAMNQYRRTKATPEEIEEAKRSERTFQFFDKFVYEKDKRFKDYEVEMLDGTRIITSYYMINFKDFHKIKCNRILNSEKYPLETKLLQLSSDTRKELTEKITNYYRLPEEDLEG